MHHCRIVVLLGLAAAFGGTTTAEAHELTCSQTVAYGHRAETKQLKDLVVDDFPVVTCVERPGDAIRFIAKTRAYWWCQGVAIFGPYGHIGAPPFMNATYYAVGRVRWGRNRATALRRC